MRLEEIFTDRADLDPAGDVEALAARAPGRWAVYLLADEADRPVQLLCVRNLRESLRRRLLDGPPAGASRKLDYRAIVRRVHWRRVDSALEADWVYLEAARRVFPSSYKGMLGFPQAWFIHVDPDAEFPRFVKTADPSRKPGLLLGPVEDKHAAARLIELLEDCFDLCRYHNILTQAPHGRACAYKQMGKCPAPCDGSISMDEYRAMVRQGVEALLDPRPIVEREVQRMRAAAEAMEFERASKVRAIVQKLQQLGQGPFRYVRPIDAFAYLAVQKGPWAKTAKLFLITPGRIEHVASLTGEPRSVGELLRHLGELARGPRGELDSAGVERLSLCAQHLFWSRPDRGVFLHVPDLDETSLISAFRELSRQKASEPADGEGVVKELQAM